ncbi:hypothetical protein AGDE_05393 [Angomonas deanei]|nr:hypothetical protein AGDE_05393 [Angomonas deanei]|eukprot:EPY38536.1 hypothetical protein AGDE_05393 [Angomonas deanei]
MIPTHSPSGEEIDGELFVKQVRGMFDMLKTTQLVEQVHEMKCCPYYACLFTNEIMFQHHSLIMPMPKYGRENRSAEMSETIRYMRGLGTTADFNHVLQDVPGGRADGNDFVSTTHGIYMGYGTSRTNSLCKEALLGDHADDTEKQKIQAIGVFPIKMDEDSPPLAVTMSFAGQRTLIVHDTVHGKKAVDQAVKAIGKVNWQVIKIEPGCHILSHLCGVNYVYDVVVDEDFPESMERLGECGLNPFPIPWSEPRKLGISMREVCLIARFARGGISGGGYWDSAFHKSTGTYNYNSKKSASNKKLYASGYRVKGDTGAPFFAQMTAGELEDLVIQPPPRYRPPMHRKGGIVPKDE